MERTIDRTSYRRNTTSVEKQEIKRSEKCFRLINVFFNQIIVSLLIIISVFIIDYCDIESAEKWIEKILNEGYKVSDTICLVKDKFYNKKENLINFSGEQFIDSGENILSGDISGEKIEFITAVEGINQMSEDAKIVKEKYELVLPLKGTITSNFGCRTSDTSIVSSYHTGLDVAANTGTNILAMNTGKVTMAKKFSSYGNCVIIESEDGKLTTLYAHCNSITVVEGQKVSAGTAIATVGMTGNATGPHLHIEMKYEGRYVDPASVLGEF